MNLQEIPTCLKINGKSLTQPHRNLLAKLQKEYDFDVLDVDLSLIANPCTGQEFGPFNPLVTALVQFVLEAYHNYASSREGNMSYRGKFVAISLYDRVKYLVLHLDSEAYYNLID